jgi:hypothetical protein
MFLVLDFGVENWMPGKLKNFRLKFGKIGEILKNSQKIF